MPITLKIQRIELKPIMDMVLNKFFVLEIDLVAVGIAELPAIAEIY